MLGTIIADIITSNFKEEQIQGEDVVLFNDDDHLTNISLYNLGGYEAFSRCACSSLNKKVYEDWLNNKIDSNDREVIFSTIFTSFLCDKTYDAVKLNHFIEEALDFDDKTQIAANTINEMIIKARLHLTKKDIGDFMKRQKYLNKEDYNLIFEAFMLFFNTNSFEGCIKLGLRQKRNRLSIIFASTLADAYYNDIDPKLIHQALTYIPSELNEIHPYSCFLAMMDEELSLRTSVEEVNDDTKFMIIQETSLDQRKYVETLHSDNEKSLKDYLIYAYAREFLTPEYHDIIADCYSERDYRTALEIYVHEYPSLNEHLEKVYELLNRIDEHSLTSDLDQDLKEFSKIFSSKEVKVEVEFFDSKEEALLKLKEKVADEVYDYKKLFATSYLIK